MKAKVPKIANGKSYALAFERIPLAIANGFPIEAIALEESIISDRLRSFLRDAVPNVVKKDKVFDIGMLISFVRIYTVRDKVILFDDVYGWVKERNKIIHGAVATRHGDDADIPASKFVASANAAARRGERLARDVCNWVRKKKAILRQDNVQAPKHTTH